MIEIDNLEKWFFDKHVITGITETIPDGECFTIIGPSGQGKSTLLRIIAMLESPSSGEIRIDGIPTSGRPSLELKRKLGMVFRQPVAFKESVYENIAIGLKYRGFGKDIIQERVSTVLEKIGLNGYEERKALTLSGGEMQRISLARILVTEPEILLLDEPTANLDPVSVQVIESMIASYHKAGHTVLLSTHDVYQGQRLCDRIGAMMHGTFIQTGTPRQIFNWPVSPEVAKFIGISDTLPGTVTRIEDEFIWMQTDFGVLKGRRNRHLTHSFPRVKDRGAVSIRPEEIAIHSLGARRIRHLDNVFTGCITEIVAHGLMAHVALDLDGTVLTAGLRWSEVTKLDLSAGSQVLVHIPAHAVHYMEMHN